MMELVVATLLSQTATASHEAVLQSPGLCGAEPLPNMDFPSGLLHYTLKSLSFPLKNDPTSPVATTGIGSVSITKRSGHASKIYCVCEDNGENCQKLCADIN